MTLAAVMMGDPALGPHPFAAGSAALQWNDMTDEAVNKLAEFFNPGTTAQ